MFDCAVPVNGAIAVIVTTRARARDAAHPAVPIVAMAQGHPGTPDVAGFERMRPTGAGLVASQLFETAGIGPADIDVCEFYDAFSIVPLLALEAYGLCREGEAPLLVANGGIAPGGKLAVNTWGGTCRDIICKA